MTGWRALIVDTVTGSIVADAVLSAVPQYTRALCDKGFWSADVVIDEKTNKGVDFHAYALPARWSWVVLYGDVAVQGGPVWTYVFKDKTRVLTVAGSGLGGLFGRRVVRNPAGPPASIASAANDITYTNLSLRGIARSLVADNLTQTGYGLPLDVPASESGTVTQAYLGTDLATVWDRLAALSQRSGGPEYDFVPVLASGATVRWRLDIGTPQLGDPASNAVWDYGAALSDIETDVNGATQPVSRVWVKGNGSGKATLFGYKENTALIGIGTPGLDYVDGNHTSETSQANLDTYATQAATDFSAATETWTATARIDGLTTQNGVEASPALGSWSLGDAPQWGIANHPWIPDGLYRRRILGVSQAADPRTVTLKVGSTLLVV